MIELINKYSEKIIKELSGDLEALILVGSYSRGEEIQGLSDIEFWAVVNDLSNTQKLEPDGNVSLGYTTRRHLKKLKPYIYTVEVKKFGKVLFGDKNILNLIPNYSYEDIDPIDAFILLNNRIVEQLILLNKIEDNQIINKYEFDKGYIQLVNSLLALNKRYRSLYPEKLEEFRKIFANDKTGLLENVEEAFASIEHPSIAAIGKNEALGKWQELRRHFKEVWLQKKERLGLTNYLANALTLGKLLQFIIYNQATSLYFSDKYQDRKRRDKVIKNWERFVK